MEIDIRCQTSGRTQYNKGGDFLKTVVVVVDHLYASSRLVHPHPSILPDVRNATAAFF